MVLMLSHSKQVKQVYHFVYLCVVVSFCVVSVSISVSVLCLCQSLFLCCVCQSLFLCVSLCFCVVSVSVSVFVLCLCQSLFLCCVCVNLCFCVCVCLWCAICLKIQTNCYSWTLCRKCWSMLINDSYFWFTFAIKFDQFLLSVAIFVV